MALNIDPKRTGPNGHPLLRLNFSRASSGTTEPTTERTAPGRQAGGVTPTGSPSSAGKRDIFDTLRQSRQAGVGAANATADVSAAAAGAGLLTQGVSNGGAVAAVPSDVNASAGSTTASPTASPAASPSGGVELTDEQRAARHAETNAAREWLWRTWPSVFNLQMLPLAIGIAREIRAEAKNAGLNLSAVNRALTRHCTARTYQWNLAQENSQRHDLTGTAVEAVTDEHRTVARKSVAQKRNNKRKANSAAGAASKDEKRPKVQLE